MSSPLTIGIPKEIKDNEYRVALTPAGVETLVRSGHNVLVEKGAGEGSGFPDEQYKAAGSRLIPDAKTVWQEADMVMKVKDPIKEEFSYFREGLVLFCFLHLAAEPELTQALAEKRVTAIAYETIQLSDGSLPVLAPMSEIAGRMSVQIGAHYLEKGHGGKGVLLGGVPGITPGHVVVIGGGGVGANAAKAALGLGAQVTLLDIDANRLRYLDDVLAGRIQLLMSNPAHIADAVQTADLLIGAVLIPGSRAPRLVTEDMVKSMMPGSVIVDVAIDQGGVIATADRVTTHSQPTYEKHGVIHYAVSNIPGAVPRTATMALTNAILPYAEQLAAKGLRKALKENAALRKGVNIHGGKVTHIAVAKDLDLEYVPLEQAFPLIES